MDGISFQLVFHRKLEGLTIHFNEKFWMETIQNVLFIANLTDRWINGIISMFPSYNQAEK